MMYYHCRKLSLLRSSNEYGWGSAVSVPTCGEVGILQKLAIARVIEVVEVENGVYPRGAF